MNYLFLTSMFPDGKEYQILGHSKGKQIASANNTFQKNIIDGFADIVTDDNIAVMNMPNIGAFPFNYSNFYYKGFSYNHNDILIDDISFINIVYIKHWHKYYKIKKRLKAYLKHNSDAKIICYDLYIPWMKALSELKGEYKFHAINIVPDLPDMTGEPDTLLYRINQLLPHYDVGKYLDVFDGYVLLAESMANALNIENKSHIVVEGIYNEDNRSNKSTEIKEKNEFVLVYAGALSIRNGIDKLVKAIHEIPSESLRLEFYGAGELVDFIKSYSKIDSRITWRGQIGHDELLENLRKADLLVNPREPDREFASYSFPSKTMEYMASGTPVLMYKLPSLPIEYYEYLYFIDDKMDAVTAMKKEISRIMDSNAGKLEKKGLDARNFILEHKRADIQARRIIDFINSL